MLQALRDEEMKILPERLKENWCKKQTNLSLIVLSFTVTFKSYHFYIHLKCHLLHMPPFSFMLPWTVSCLLLSFTYISLHS